MEIWSHLLSDEKNTMNIPHLPFYFIRHGETDWNRLNKIMGQKDIPLNERGITQAHHATVLLKKIKFGKIWSSPLQRARQTAEIINKSFSYPIDYHDKLMERHWGVNEEGPPEQFLPDLRPTFRIREDKDDKIPEGAEPYCEFEARVIEAFKEILIPNPIPPLVVGHGGVFRVLTNLLANSTFSVENCALYLFRPPEHPTHPWVVMSLSDE